MLGRSKQWCTVKAWGLRIAAKRGHKRAVVAVARKLAVIMHRMWLDGSAFRFAAADGSESSTGASKTTALAAVVITAALRIVDFSALRLFYRVRRSDFILSVVAFVAVAALGVLNGIAVATAMSLLDVVRRVWRPHDAILGRAAGVKGYHDITRYRDAKQIPGLLLFRWDAPLFFANAETFRAHLLDAFDRANFPVKWVVVAAEPITDVDTTAAEILEDLDAELAARGAELAFAELKDPVRDRLQNYGIEKRIGRDFFFTTVGVAVKTFLARHDVDWTDWEETPEE